MSASSSGLHQSIFYLPQKPYNVLGTLWDQMTYPATRDEAGTEAETKAGSGPETLLRAVLDQVDLGYLLEREGVLTSEINWEEECSLGEKQRLAIARLIWHKPQFAILDEVSADPTPTRPHAHTPTRPHVGMIRVQLQVQH